MSYQSVFKRYEIKYLLTDKQAEELFSIMSEYMEPDQYCKNTICNVYFDTPDKYLIRHSLSKPYYKEKLRVRSYGVANPDSTTFIELKKKYDGVVYKRRMTLPQKQAHDYLVNKVSLGNDDQISKEIDYFLKFYQNIEPAVFLSYDREAYCGKEDENFRMTFDRNIEFRDYDLSLSDGIYGEKLLPDNTVLLEVKTAMGIPRWLLDFFSKNKIYKTSFSKYGNAYSKKILPKYLGGKNNVFQ